MKQNIIAEITYLKQQPQEFLIKRILELEDHIEELYNQQKEENNNEIQSIQEQER
jgi:hypothetical protein